MSLDQMPLLQNAVLAFSKNKLCLESPERESPCYKRSYLEQYRADVQKIFEAFDDFNVTLKEMRDLNVKYQSNHQVETVAAARHAFVACGTVQSRRLFAIKKTIDAIRAANAILKKEFQLSRGRIGNTELSIRINVCHVLDEKLASSAMQLNDAQYKFKCDVSDKEARMTKLNAATETRQSEGRELDSPPDDEMQYMIMTGNGKSTGNSTLFDMEIAAEALLDKLNDIKQLESNILLLHSLFVELASVVAEGSMKLQAIEDKVLEANDNQERVHEQLERVRRNQIKKNKRATKWSIFLIFIVVCIVLTVVFSKT